MNQSDTNQACRDFVASLEESDLSQVYAVLVTEHSKSLFIAALEHFWPDAEARVKGPESFEAFDRRMTDPNAKIVI